VSKTVLKISILVTGILLGFLQYKLKPPIDEQAINNLAQDASSTIEWQGQIAPDFALRMISGENFQLSDNVGKKIIVLNFFATWCGPCQDEMPELNRYFDQHRSESFLLVGIDADEKQDLVGEFVKDYKLDFQVGIDDGTVEKQYGVTAFPTTVLVGVDGKVQFYEAGELANAEVAFDSLLKKNTQLMAAGKTISSDDYRAQARAQKALPRQHVQEAKSDDGTDKLDARGKRIVARMDCPCGCDQKVQACTCNTSTNIKNALTKENFNKKSDDEIIRELNKRFCVGGGS
jgi:peroxiredoxin